ncbi:MAG TPA: hypothetical protein VGV63_09240 [Acidimicrobiales bacterium]|nr:hypothetical protein [Acidimicrobiales bacterium]
MRRTLALLSALLLAGGCSDDGEQPPPAATVPSEVTTSTTAPAAPDPAVIPDDLAEIDEEYVQAVVDELFAVDAKATGIFLTTKTLDERAIEYLQAIYTEEELDRQVDHWFQDLAHRSDELLPGALRNRVTRVIQVGDDCVYVEVETDYSQVSTRKVPPAHNYLGLTPKLDGDDPGGLNPTAWVLFMDGVEPDGSPPENPCEGR